MDFPDHPRRHIGENTNSHSISTAKYIAFEALQEQLVSHFFIAGDGAVVFIMREWNNAELSGNASCASGLYCVRDSVNIRVLFNFGYKISSLSRRTESGEKAGKHTAIYSAPFSSGVLYWTHSLAPTIIASPAWTFNSSVFVLTRSIPFFEKLYWSTLTFGSPLYKLWSVIILFF